MSGGPSLSLALFWADPLTGRSLGGICCLMSQVSGSSDAKWGTWYFPHKIEDGMKSPMKATWIVLSLRERSFTSSANRLGPGGSRGRCLPVVGRRTGQKTQAAQWGDCFGSRHCSICGSTRHLRHAIAQALPLANLRFMYFFTQ